MAKTKEQLDTEQRKREAYLRKKEKTEFNKERQRLREELARDKAERASHKGKLSSRLGVDGYKPDGIQYDVPGSEDSGQPIAVVESAEGNGEIDHKPKKAKADFTRIDEFIGKVSSYRAGGDGGKCLKILKTYVENVVDNPLDVKFRTINTENKVYKTKVKPFVGAKSLLLVCGFDPSDNGESLELKTDADLNVLAEIKTKLEAAMIQYG